MLCLNDVTCLQFFFLSDNDSLLAASQGNLWLHIKQINISILLVVTHVSFLQNNTSLQTEIVLEFVDYSCLFIWMTNFPWHPEQV